MNISIFIAQIVPSGAHVTKGAEDEISYHNKKSILYTVSIKDIMNLV